jgi:hypothetical protein
LTSLKSLQPDARVLAIILEAETIFIGGYQVVFEECFQNTNEGQIVSRLFDEVDHRLWLQSPLNQFRVNGGQVILLQSFVKFKSFAYINHLVVEVGAIFYFYFIYISSLLLLLEKTRSLD